MTPQPIADGSFNLERFMKNLTLERMVHGERAPPMPPPNCHSTMTPLVMRPSGYRKLQEIKDLEYLEDEATFCKSKFVDKYE